MTTLEVAKKLNWIKKPEGLNWSCTVSGHVYKGYNDLLSKAYYWQQEQNNYYKENGEVHYKWQEGICANCYMKLMDWDLEAPAKGLCCYPGEVAHAKASVMTKDQPFALGVCTYHYLVICGIDIASYPYTDFIDKENPMIKGCVAYNCNNSVNHVLNSEVYGSNLFGYCQPHFYGLVFPTMKPATLGYKCTYKIDSINGPSCNIKAVYEDHIMGKGLCEMHYEALKNLGFLNAKEAKAMPIPPSVKKWNPYAGLPKAPSLKEGNNLQPLPQKPIYSTRGLSIGDKKGLYIPLEHDGPNTQHATPSEHKGEIVFSDFEKTIKELGIQPKFNLLETAADFYLLSYITYSEPTSVFKKAETLLDKHITFSAEQMARYIEVACFGEARYASHKVDSFHHTHGPKFLKNPRWKTLYKELTGGMDRWSAWGKFKKASEIHGKNRVILFTAQIHDQLAWHGGFGGKKWALCTKVVLAYRRGKISARSFMDTAFGLEHNGNLVFDKLWNVQYLKKLLDYNLNDQMDKLVPYATKPVQEIWKKFKVELEGEYVEPVEEKEICSCGDPNCNYNKLTVGK